MDEFIDVFGGVTLEKIVTVSAACVFIGGVLRAVWKYVNAKITKMNERDAEWQKIAEQVQQYPKWHRQSIEIRDELAKSIKSLSAKIDETNRTLDEIQLRSKRNYATECRYRIIRFNDELLQHGDNQILHTKEHFDQLLSDIDEYEDYCKIDADYKNSKAVLAIANIRNVYQRCIENGEFL